MFLIKLTAIISPDAGTDRLRAGRSEPGTASRV
jgi:hypothetical protein